MLLVARRPTAALTIAWQWVELESLEDEAQHRLIELLAATGERAEGLRQAESYEKLLREDGLEPLDETKKLLERLRIGEAIDLAVPEVANTPHNDATISSSGDDSETRGITPRAATIPLRWALITVVGVVLFSAAVVAVYAATRDSRVILAVGDIADHSGLDSLQHAQTMRGLLESELLRIRGAAVISASRLAELRRSMKDNPRQQQSLELTARRAGATDVI